MIPTLKGKKSYLLAIAVIGYAVFGIIDGSMSVQSALDYVMSGAALATIRAAIAKN